MLRHLSVISNYKVLVITENQSIKDLSQCVNLVKSSFRDSYNAKIAQNRVEMNDMDGGIASEEPEPQSKEANENDKYDWV